MANITPLTADGTIQQHPDIGSWTADTHYLTADMVSWIVAWIGASNWLIDLDLDTRRRKRKKLHDSILLLLS